MERIERILCLSFAHSMFEIDKIIRNCRNDNRIANVHLIDDIRMIVNSVQTELRKGKYPVSLRFDPGVRSKFSYITFTLLDGTNDCTTNRPIEMLIWKRHTIYPGRIMSIVEDRNKHIVYHDVNAFQDDLETLGKFLLAFAIDLTL